MQGVSLRPGEECGWELGASLNQPQISQTSLRLKRVTGCPKHSAARAFGPPSLKQCPFLLSIIDRHFLKVMTVTVTIIIAII